MRSLKLSLVKVNCKLKIGDLRKLETIGPTTTVDKSYNNIFDESIYADCYLLCDDVDRSNSVCVIVCSTIECVNIYSFTALRFNAEFLANCVVI